MGLFCQLEVCWSFMDNYTIYKVLCIFILSLGVISAASTRSTTPSLTSSISYTSTVSQTVTPTYSGTDTPSPSMTATPVPSNTPTPIPSNTPTPIPSTTSTLTASTSFSSSISISFSPTISVTSSITPTISNSVWVKPVFSTETIWILSSLGVALAIITVVGIGVYYMRLRKQRNTLPSYNDGVF